MSQDFTFSDKDIVRIICNHLTTDERENVINFLAIKKNYCDKYIENDDISFELNNITTTPKTESEDETIKQIKEIFQQIRYLIDILNINDDLKQGLYEILDFLEETIEYLWILLGGIVMLIIYIKDFIDIMKTIKDSWMGRRPGIRHIIDFIFDKFINPFEDFLNEHETHIERVKQKILELLQRIRSLLSRLRN